MWFWNTHWLPPAYSIQKCFQRAPFIKGYCHTACSSHRCQVARHLPRHRLRAEVHGHLLCHRGRHVHLSHPGAGSPDWIDQIGGIGGPQLFALSRCFMSESTSAWAVPCNMRPANMWSSIMSRDYCWLRHRRGIASVSVGIGSPYHRRESRFYYILLYYIILDYIIFYYVIFSRCSYEHGRRRGRAGCPDSRLRVAAPHTHYIYIYIYIYVCVYIYIYIKHIYIYIYIY